MLRGVEVAAQTQFSMLPAPFDGLGASISATFIQGHSTLDGERIPLLEQPKHVYSITGFFQKGPWDASVSYVLNAAYLTDLDTDNSANDIFQGKFGRIDAKLSYAIGNRLKIFVEGVNLNDEPTSEFQGHSVTQATEYEYVGRTIYAGVSLGFGRK
jgi:outer membrane receptor protein involved in Fe transport